MELKDAIAQLEDLIKDRKSFIVDDNSIEWNEIWLRDIDALKIGIAAIKRLLEKRGADDGDDEAQTIEAEPVKHGRWLPHKIAASSICSLCRRVFADETKYCPNCGAKMDLKEGESE